MSTPKHAEQVHAEPSATHELQQPVSGFVTRLRARGASTRAPQRLERALLWLSGLGAAAALLLFALSFPAYRTRAAREALQKKAAADGAELARRFAPALTRDARASQAFAALVRDRDITSLTLLDAEGDTLYQAGVPGGWLEGARRGVDKQYVIPLFERIAVVTPVIAAQGARGTLALELSTQELATTEIRATRELLYAALLLLVGLLVYARLRRDSRGAARITRPGSS